MLDPIPPPSAQLSSAIAPFASWAELPTLTHHVHEVLFATFFYTTCQTVVSPVVSTYLFPRVYPNFAKRTKVNWDVHVVSLIQSILINSLALWVMAVDKERSSMDAVERVYGYTGGCGFIQGLATGYFVWDLLVSGFYFKIFGPGILAHAVSALWVFSFGFRPFLNYYGPVFILYELSTPFLNLHWFFDKVNMTGSRPQWYNGILLIGSFFGCRLVWGTYQSVLVYQDVWASLTARNKSGGIGVAAANVSSTIPIFTPRDNVICAGDRSCVAANAEIMKFTGPDTQVPVWLAITYMGSNIVLNSLNFYWFGKMIETVRKRFEEKAPEKPKLEGAGAVKSEEARRRRESVVLDAADGLENDEMRMGFEIEAVDGEAISTSVDAAQEARRRN